MKTDGVLVASYPNPKYQANLPRANLKLLLYFLPVIDITAHDIPRS